MRLIFQREAQAELIDAAQYYQSRVQGLGDEFLNEVNVALARIEAAPMLNRIHHFGARRLIVDRFPYSVYYRVFADHIQILALHHHSRRPGYWRSRAKN